MSKGFSRPEHWSGYFPLQSTESYLPFKEKRIFCEEPIIMKSFMIDYRNAVFYSFSPSVTEEFIFRLRISTYSIFYIIK